MNKRVRLVWVLMAFAAAASPGCSHKPAYSEIDVNRSSRDANQNRGVPAGTTASAGAEVPGGTAGEAATSPPPVQNVKMPSFLDRGNIKDLPNYPRSRISNIQIGPNQGLNTITLGLQTNDTMDKIAAYYEEVIKSNRWTVVSKTIDPDRSDWVLKKGEDQAATIQVKKDPQTARIGILIVRGEKMEEPAKESPTGL